MFTKNKIEDSEDSGLRIRPDSHNTQFIEAMARYYFIRSLVKGKRVLDAGCGYGYGASYLVKWAEEVIGVDFSQQAIDWAQRNYHNQNLKFAVSNLTELEFSDEYFDVVCLFEVIHQLEEYHELLSELYRVLKKDGIFLISTRNRKSEEPIAHPHHVREFKPQELKEILLKFGFGDIKIYGVSRPEDIYHLEDELKNIRKFDFLGIKRIIPRCLISSLVYFVAKAKGITPPQELTYENFEISENNLETSPGFLIICRKNNKDSMLNKK
jgi:ubiquinone/menaquinone biosynthesis C-methylase UbiE